MTTAFILTLGCFGFLGYVVIELVLWLLEVIFATVKFILCYLTNRPCSWQQSYLGIRIIFTWVLQWVSFAELSPAHIYKHRHGIQRYMQTLVAKQNRRRKEIMSHLHRKKANAKEDKPNG